MSKLSKQQIAELITTKDELKAKCIEAGWNAGCSAVIEFNQIKKQIADEYAPEGFVSGKAQLTVEEWKQLSYRQMAYINEVQRERRPIFPRIGEDDAVSRLGRAYINRSSSHVSTHNKAAGEQV